MQHEPISILSNGLLATVLVSSDHYARMGGHNERIRRLLEVHREASANGLMPAILHGLLANE